MTEFDAATCGNCIRILLDGMTDAQRGHAAAFLLAEIERLYLAGGNKPPAWIRELRAAGERGEAAKPPLSS